jgi:hypothetical protein
MSTDDREQPESEWPQLPCPTCGRYTDSLKQYANFPHLVIFLLIFAVSQRATYVGCPGCIRAKIGTQMLINLITANIISPIILPIQACWLIPTFMKGHSKSIRDLIQRR